MFEDITKRGIAHDRSVLLVVVSERIEVLCLCCGHSRENFANAQKRFSNDRFLVIVELCLSHHSFEFFTVAHGEHVELHTTLECGVAYERVPINVNYPLVNLVRDS